MHTVGTQCFYTNSENQSRQRNLFYIQRWTWMPLKAKHPKISEVSKTTSALLFSFKWKQNVQEFTSQGQVSDTPPLRLYPGTPTLHQGLVCNNLSWWGGHFIYRFLCAQRLCKNPHFVLDEGKYLHNKSSPYHLSFSHEAISSAGVGKHASQSVRLDEHPKG